MKRENEFGTERWCSRMAAAHGVPTPEIVGDGVIEDVSYGVQRFALGVSGDTLDEPRLWETLGGYARVISRIRLTEQAPDGLFSRFGRELPDAWQAHLAYNLDELTPGDPLVALGVYAAESRGRLERMFCELGAVPLEFGLSHGDMTTRNLLVHGRQPPVLVDWGSAAAGPTPYTDLVILMRDHRHCGRPDAVALDAFAAGWGTTIGHLQPTLAAIECLSAVDTVRWALDRRPDRLEAAAAEARDTLRRVWAPDD